MSAPTIQPGRADPLGATWDGTGVNFAVWSEHATAAELCLFDPAAPAREIARLPLPGCEQGVWHGYVPGTGPGALYAFRMHGPWVPEEGHRFNPAKLLLDPYARAISGPCVWHPTLVGERPGVGGPAPTPDDSADHVPRAVVIDPAFDWEGDRPPAVPWTRTVIYESHVKGLTAWHPAVPPRRRGTYEGLTADPVLAHLARLGVTAVELLPVHHHVTERHLVERRLANYWGYSSIGFFAPDERFASGARGEQVVEFKRMVRALHRAGLEVLLDVVYNHTGEGTEAGPTLAFRGLDNAGYYRLRADDRRRYADVTGCGNTLDLTHPRVLQLVLDSLRYWVTEMHVDGFRFDLAPALVRDRPELSRTSGFLAAVEADPVLRRVKLIAEPWDLGEDGYRVGRFPRGWAEWNGRYRDTVRSFWRGDDGQLSDLASRLTGSSDAYGAGDRGPLAGVSFVTCHDGFTLADLVSYEDKHNEPNGEGNRDGTDHNLSANYGAEGPTADAAILAARRRQARNLLVTLLLSQGVPMLAAGDEMGRTQAGNNNAYCQDGPVSWLAWSGDAEARALTDLVGRLVALRQAHPIFRRARFFTGRAPDGGAADLTWLRADGKEMTAEDWADPQRRAIGLLLDGEALDERDETGAPLHDDTFLVLLNADPAPVAFTLPGAADSWSILIDTRDAPPPASAGAAEAVALEGRSALVLARRT